MENNKQTEESQEEETQNRLLHAKYLTHKMKELREQELEIAHERRQLLWELNKIHKVKQVEIADFIELTRQHLHNEIKKQDILNS